MISIWEWIKADWHSHRLRFLVELYIWLDGLACAVIINWSAPDMPWLLVYPLWVSGCAAYAWSSWSRRSVGNLATGLMILGMDSWGYLKVLL